MATTKGQRKSEVEGLRQMNLGRAAGGTVGDAVDLGAGRRFPTAGQGTPDGQMQPSSSCGNQQDDDREPLVFYCQVYGTPITNDNHPACCLNGRRQCIPCFYESEIRESPKELWNSKRLSKLYFKPEWFRTPEPQELCVGTKIWVYEVRKISLARFMLIQHKCENEDFAGISIEENMLYMYMKSTPYEDSRVYFCNTIRKGKMVQYFWWPIRENPQVTRIMHDAVALIDALPPELRSERYDAALYQIFESLIEKDLPRFLSDNQMQEVCTNCDVPLRNVRSLWIHLRFQEHSLNAELREKSQDERVNQLIADILENNPCGLHLPEMEWVGLHLLIVRKIYREIVRNNYIPVLSQYQLRRISVHIGRPIECVSAILDNVISERFPENPVQPSHQVRNPNRGVPNEAPNNDFDGDNNEHPRPQFASYCQMFSTKITTDAPPPCSIHSRNPCLPCRLEIIFKTSPREKWNGDRIQMYRDHMLDHELFRTAEPYEFLDGEIVNSMVVRKMPITRYIKIKEKLEKMVHEGITVEESMVFMWMKGKPEKDNRVKFCNQIRGGKMIQYLWEPLPDNPETTTILQNALQLINTIHEECKYGWIIVLSQIFLSFVEKRLPRYLRDDQIRFVFSNSSLSVEKIQTFIIGFRHSEMNIRRQPTEQDAKVDRLIEDILKKNPSGFHLPLAEFEKLQKNILEKIYRAIVQHKCTPVLKDYQLAHLNAYLGCWMLDTNKIFEELHAKNSSSTSVQPMNVSHIAQNDNENSLGDGTEHNSGDDIYQEVQQLPDNNQNNGRDEVANPKRKVPVSVFLTRLLTKPDNIEQRNIEQFFEEYRNRRPGDIEDWIRYGLNRLDKSSSAVKSVKLVVSQPEYIEYIVDLDAIQKQKDEPGRAPPPQAIQQMGSPLSIDSREQVESDGEYDADGESESDREDQEEESGIPAQLGSSNVQMDADPSQSEHDLINGNQEEQPDDNEIAVFGRNEQGRNVPEEPTEESMDDVAPAPPQPSSVQAAVDQLKNRLAPNPNSGLIPSAPALNQDQQAVLATPQATQMQRRVQPPPGQPRENRQNRISGRDQDGRQIPQIQAVNQPNHRVLRSRIQPARVPPPLPQQNSSQQLLLGHPLTQAQVNEILQRNSYVVHVQPLSDAQVEATMARNRMAPYSLRNRPQNTFRATSRT